MAAARPEAVSGKVVAPMSGAFFGSERAEFSRQRVGPLRDRARAEKHHIIAWPRDLFHDSGEHFGAVKRNHVAMAARAQPLHQRVAVDTRNRRFARGIDRRHDDVVSIVETGTELLEQIAEPRVAVRLHDGDDMTLGGGARGLQGGCNLDRMMAVIVEDRDAVPFAGARKAALHAAEASERLADLVVRDTKLTGNRDRRRGIKRVVM